MGIIFDKPVIDTEKCTIGGQELTLFEFTADVYYDHLMTPEALGALQERQRKEAERADVTSPPSAAPAEDEAPDPAELVEAYRADKNYKLMACACSLAPGYPDRTVEQLRDELARSLKTEQLRKLSDQVFALNGLNRPKSDAPAGDSSDA